MLTIKKQIELKTKANPLDPHDRRQIKEHYKNKLLSKNITVGEARQAIKDLDYDLYVTSDKYRGFILCDERTCEHWESVSCGKYTESDDIENCDICDGNYHRGMP